MSGREFDLEELSGIGRERANQLRAEGYQTIDDIKLATVEELATVTGISRRIAEEIHREAGGKLDETDRPPSAPPMGADDLVQLDNEPGEIDPEEIADLREPHLYLSSGAEQQRPTFEVSETQFDDQWRVALDADLVTGQIGRERDAVETPTRDDPVEHEFDSFRPDESGVTYHPKIASDQHHRQLQRRSGQLVTPERVFGADDRQVFYPSGYPWRCTGKIFAWTNPSGDPAWVGSGALVGTNVVLTASHVVPWGADPWMMRFVPSYWDGSSLYGSGVSSYVQSVRGYRNHKQGDDMAVLKLYTSLGNSLGYFGYKTYHDSWEGGNYWTKVGYPVGVASGNRPSRVTWYPIIDDDNDGAGVELEYKADSSGGGSGGPVFGWWSGSPYVIGTHSGSETEYHFPWYLAKHNLSAGGGALSSLIGWARSNW